MYPILLSFGQVNIYTHGVMIALGVVLGGGIIFYLAKKEHLSRKFLFDLLVFSLFGGIVGARIVYVIFYYYQFTNWHEMFFIWRGGLVSFGGIIGGFLVSYFILKKRRQNIWQWFDLGIIGLLAGWTIGRIGCLLSGDVPGIASSSKIAIWGQIPVSLFEAIWSFVIAGFLFYLVLWQKKWVQTWTSGSLFWGGLALYGLGRLVIDFWRDERVILIIKGGQIVSLLVFLLALGILIWQYLEAAKGGKNA